MWWLQQSPQRMLHWQHNGYEQVIEDLDRTIPPLPTDVLDKIKNYLHSYYCCTSYIPNFNRCFKYNNKTTAIGGCNPNAIRDIVTNAIEVVDNSSAISIRFVILATLKSLNSNNKKIRILFDDIDYIIESNLDDDLHDFDDNLYDHDDYNEFYEKYNEMHRLLYDSARLIICGSIFIWFASKRHDSLNHYLRKLYNHIHSFKLMIYEINLSHRRIWPEKETLFKPEDNLNWFRLNMFIFHSCGLKNQPTYNPLVDIEIDYRMYVEDLENDIKNIQE